MVQNLLQVLLIACIVKYCYVHRQRLDCTFHGFQVCPCAFVQLASRISSGSLAGPSPELTAHMEQVQMIPESVCVDAAVWDVPASQTPCHRPLCSMML